MNSNQNKHTIVIEGPAGAGKGTAALLLARRLNYLYLDTGALYRGIAFYCLEKDLDPNDQETVSKLLNSINLKYNNSQGNFKYNILINGIDVTSKLRTQQVSMATSIIAGYPEVVTKVKQTIETLIKSQGIVAEGQTIVENLILSPDLLIYLTADPETRALRRYQELLVKDPNITFQEVLNSMKERDQNDQNRVFNKMRIHSNALIIDSSNLTIDQVVDKIHQLVIN